MKKITTIFFDIGGVLFDLQLDETVDYLAEKCNLDRDQVGKAFPLEIYFEFERGRMDEVSFFNHWRRALGCNGVSNADFTRAWDLLVGEELPTVAILEKLLPHYQIWLLSNTNDYHIRTLTPRFPVFEKVHGKIYSYLEGCRKPEAEIFELALHRVGTVAKESVFIDDMDVNIEQARKMGFTALKFSSAGELEVELKLLGLKGLD